MTDISRVEEARKVLAEFDAEARAAAEAQQHAADAEQARQADRRRRWAETYAPTAGADLARAFAAARQAETEFVEALAAEPWVQALVRWQAAESGPAAAVTRSGHARHILGQLTAPDERPGTHLVEYNNAVPSIPRLLRALGRLLDSAAPYEPLADVDGWVTATDDGDTLPHV